MTSEELCGQWDWVRGELFQLRFRWVIYRALFFDHPERRALLNRAASETFGHIQHGMFVSVLLGIPRIIEDRKSFGCHNLTFDAILTGIRKVGNHQELSVEPLTRRLHVLQKNTNAIATFTDKVLRHADKAWAIDGELTPLQVDWIEAFFSEALGLAESINDLVGGAAWQIAEEFAIDQVATVIKLISIGIDAREMSADQLREYWIANGRLPWS